jgi:hypothetical protein
VAALLADTVLVAGAVRTARKVVEAQAAALTAAVRVEARVVPTAAEAPVHPAAVLRGAAAAIAKEPNHLIPKSFTIKRVSTVTCGEIAWVSKKCRTNGSPFPRRVACLCTKAATVPNRTTASPGLKARVRTGIGVPLHDPRSQERDLGHPLMVLGLWRWFSRRLFNRSPKVAAQLKPCAFYNN